MWLFRKKTSPTQDHDPDDVAVARRHLKTILEIVNSHTGTDKTHRRRSDEVSVVVPYQDILRIWDLADRAISRL